MISALTSHSAYVPLSGRTDASRENAAGSVGAEGDVAASPLTDLLGSPAGTLSPQTLALTSVAASAFKPAPATLLDPATFAAGVAMEEGQEAPAASAAAASAPAAKPQREEADRAISAAASRSARSAYEAFQELLARYGVNA